MSAFKHRQLLANSHIPRGFLNREHRARSCAGWLWLWPRGQSRRGRALWVDVGSLKSRLSPKSPPPPPPRHGPSGGRGRGVVYDPGTSSGTDPYSARLRSALKVFGMPVQPPETQCGRCDRDIRWSERLIIHTDSERFYGCVHCWPPADSEKPAWYPSIGTKYFSEFYGPKKGGA